MREFLPNFAQVGHRGGLASVPRDRVMKVLGLLADIRACTEDAALTLRDAREAILTCDDAISRLSDLLQSVSDIQSVMLSSQCPLVPCCVLHAGDAVEVAAKAGAEEAFRCELWECQERAIVSGRELRKFVELQEARATTRTAMKRRRDGDVVETSSLGPGHAVPCMGVSNVVVNKLLHVVQCARRRPPSELLSNFVSNADFWSAVDGRITTAAATCFVQAVGSAATAAGVRTIVLDCAHMLCMQGGRHEDDRACAEFTAALAGEHLRHRVLCVVPLSSGAYLFVAVTHPHDEFPGSIIVAHPLGDQHGYSRDAVEVAEMIRRWLASQTSAVYHLSLPSPTMAVPPFLDVNMAGAYSLAYAYFFAMMKRFPTEADIPQRSSPGIRFALICYVSIGSLLCPSLGEDTTFYALSGPPPSVSRFLADSRVGRLRQLADVA